MQQLQGTLQVSLRNSQSGQSIDDNEVRRKFQQFGDVKSVQPVGDRTELSVSRVLVQSCVLTSLKFSIRGILRHKSPQRLFSSFLLCDSDILRHVMKHSIVCVTRAYKMVSWILSLLGTRMRLQVHTDPRHGMCILKVKLAHTDVRVFQRR